MEATRSQLRAAYDGREEGGCSEAVEEIVGAPEVGSDEVEERCDEIERD